MIYQGIANRDHTPEEKRKSIAEYKKRNAQFLPSQDVMVQNDFGTQVPNEVAQAPMQDVNVQNSSPIVNMSPDLAKPKKSRMYKHGDKFNTYATPMTGVTEDSVPGPAVDD